MIVCHCERVTDRRVAMAVKGGCTSVSEVGRDTSAGRGCGGCVSSLRALIERFLAPTDRMEPTHEAA
jgi:bacterioferritin-associated ferredoxin